MADQARTTRMTEEEYLQMEESARIRHEYVDGYVFAMSGATEAHNIICGNIFSFLHTHLSDSPCRAFMNDMKVMIRSAKSFYYPDILVTCEPFEAKSVFKSSPVLLIEVLSPGTAQIDHREKLIAYQKIASLREYLMVHQDRQRVELLRREAEEVWTSFIFKSGDYLVLKSVPGGPLFMPFGIIYARYNPPSRVKESECLYDSMV